MRCVGVMRRSSGRAAIDVEPAQHAYRPDRPQLPIRRFPAGSRAPRIVARWRMDRRGLRPHRSQRRPARADRARDAPRLRRHRQGTALRLSLDRADGRGNRSNRDGRIIVPGMAERAPPLHELTVLRLGETMQDKVFVNDFDGAHGLPLRRPRIGRAPLCFQRGRSDLSRRIRIRIRGAPPGRHRAAHGVPSAHPPPRLQTQVPTT